ncbi:hypothetical protein PLICRDRAFT_46316 [Plicaturopsis crispa FD-325 SS-3]|uniref:DUF7918 domain-containing protein n=1 Tax=Plicaturopsis crispa FD-325 SS-3 TaxID=944288 RepID=A0A0C9T899_PLICR|nr:hypothetical protein PLICRDRAFT_46316 [Plicaturopsis crispa FD-325 SS-3]
MLPFTRQGGSRSHQPPEVQKRGLVTSDRTARNFVFARVETTEDVGGLNMHRSLHRFGEIRLEIWRIAVDSTVQAVGVTNNFKGSRIHERPTQVMEHCVGLGPEIQVQKRFRRTVKLDPRPIVTFIFKYRSLDQLKADGIVVPRSGEKRETTSEPSHEVEPGQHDSDLDYLDALRAGATAIQETIAAMENARRVKRVCTKNETNPRGGKVLALDGGFVFCTVRGRCRARCPTPFLMSRYVTLVYTVFLPQWQGT